MRSLKNLNLKKKKKIPYRFGSFLCQWTPDNLEKWNRDKWIQRTFLETQSEAQIRKPGMYTSSNCR